MKPSHPAAFAAALVFAGHAASAPLEDAERKAAVTLPYAEVKALLEAARPAPGEPRPPVPFAVASASIALSLTAPAPSAVAAFEVDVFAKGWQLVPLIGTPFALKSVTSPGATVLVRDGMLCLLAREPGHFPVTLTFEIPEGLTEPGGAPLPLRLAAAAAGQITVASLPERVRAIISSGAQRTAGNALPVPPAGGEVLLSLVEDRAVVATRWAADTRTLVVQRGDRLVVRCRIRLAGGSGSGLSASLDLPASAMDVRISGPDLQPMNLQAGRGVALGWNTADILSREIAVEFEQPAPAPGDPWTVEIPRVRDATRSHARTIVVPQPGIVLSSESARAFDPARPLPAWADASAGMSGALESDSTQPFVVETRILPRLEADTARIPKAEFRTRLVPDGALLCEAQVQFQHRGPLRWRFSLPEDSELLSCEVDGSAVNPLIAAAGLLELAIAGRPEADTSSRVRLSYTARGPAFAPVEGRLGLVLPSTPLFVEELNWELVLPDGYESTAFEGNVEPVAGDGIHFRKRLVRNSAAAVEIYYRKRDTNR